MELQRSIERVVRASTVFVLRETPCSPNCLHLSCSVQTKLLLVDWKFLGVLNERTSFLPSKQGRKRGAPKSAKALEEVKTISLFNFPQARL